MTESNAQSRLDDMIRKVEALFRQAEHKNTTESEAEVFFAKAQQLMSKHNIDEAMIRKAQPEIPAEKVLHEDMAIKRSGFFESMVRLATACADANDVRCLVKTPKEWGEAAGIRFVGLESNIIKTKLLYVALLGQCIRFRRNVPEYVVEESALMGGNGHIQRWRRDFSLGYASRIGARLREMKRATEREAEKTPGVALILSDRRAEVDSLFNSMAGAPRRSRSRKGPMADAYDAGGRAADRADLGGTGRVGGGTAGQIES